MKFTLSRTSNYTYPPPVDFVELNTIDELLEFVKKSCGQIVLATDDPTPNIEIYDDYRE